MYREAARLRSKVLGHTIIVNQVGKAGKSSLIAGLSIVSDPVSKLVTVSQMKRLSTSC